MRTYIMLNRSGMLNSTSQAFPSRRHASDVIFSSGAEMQEAGTGFIGDAQTSNWTYSRRISICHKLSSQREPNGAPRAVACHVRSGRSTANSSRFPGFAGQLWRALRRQGKAMSSKEIMEEGPSQNAGLLNTCQLTGIAQRCASHC